MTTVDQGDVAAPVDATTTAGHEPSGGWWPRWRGAARRELPSSLEILALTTFVVARPVLGSFGRSPESFLARDADWTDVIAFGLVVVLAPAALVVAGEIVLGLFGDRARRLGHLAAVAALLSLGAWQLIDPLGGWREVGVAGSVAVAGGLTVARARAASLGTFLRYASLGAAVFLVQFLALSPVSSIVLGGRHVGTDAGAAGAAGDDAPPVVVVVMDGLPTGLLLDGEGHIDADLYPSIASLTADATWYRNHTTVAQITLDAVPAILSGTRPSAGGKPPVASNYPHSIFTLLGGTHDVHGAEAITGVCPVDLCPEPPGSPLAALVHDAARVWRWQMLDAEIDPELVPNAFDDRYDRTDEWIAGQDFSRGERPGLWVYHMLLPHPRWEYLPDGTRYEASARPAGLFIDTWSGWGADVARQRHVLQTQAADRQLGEFVDRLRADDAYDDSLIVVTADHGYAFAADTPWRALDDDNYDQILWTPLIVKAPGQREPVIDDRNVNSTDIVPTIAAEMGIDELPWDADGEPAGTSERDPDDKWVVDWDCVEGHNEIRAYVVDGPPTAPVLHELDIEARSDG